MSQVNDVNLANQGFATFRSELNDILGALNTMHVGASAPTCIVFKAPNISLSSDLKVAKP